MRWWWCLVLAACDDRPVRSESVGADAAQRPPVDVSVVDEGRPDDGARPDRAPEPPRDGSPPADAAGPADAAVAVDGAPPADARPPGDATSPDAEVPEIPCLFALVREGDFEIFAHEASRPDARFDHPGEAMGGACSRPGVLPWTHLTSVEAQAACQASGFHLCTDAEWQYACQGDRRWGFPYGAEHDPGTCNDHVSGTGRVQPTGTLVDCRTPEGVYDLSGNVWEMTADGNRRGASWLVNAVMFRAEAARCDVTYFNSEIFYADDLGFRCCRPVP